MVAEEKSRPSGMAQQRRGRDGLQEHRLLLVDQDDDEAELFRSVYEDLKMPIQVFQAKNGEDCLQRLPDIRPRPELILLEIDLPRLDGLKTLRRLKEVDQFRHIPVVVFTNSDDPYHIHDCYHHFAAAYVEKPIDPDDYRALVKAMHTFWFDHAALCDD